MELQDYILASTKDDFLLAELQNQEITKQQLDAIKTAKTLKNKVIEVLKTVCDPELPVNIWDLGLVYKLKTDKKDNSVYIDMTLTAPACPVAGAMPIEVEKRIKALLPKVEKVTVNLVWQPRWNKDMMSEDAKLILDMW